MIAELVQVLSGACMNPLPPHTVGWIDRYTYHNQSNSNSPCECYQSLLEISMKDVIIYVHDDVTIHDHNWLKSVMITLESNPNCVAVGFGGATGLGNKDLYRKSFNIWNMARSGYCSNQTDAETHGIRFSGVKRVAVLDAFFMAVRRDFLLRIGGWPVNRLTHHCIDLWLACEAARHNKEIWVTGVSCTHHGGGTSVKDTYRKAKWLQGGTLESDHLLPHKWLASEYIDVLPILIKS